MFKFLQYRFKLQVSLQSHANQKTTMTQMNNKTKHTTMTYKTSLCTSSTRRCNINSSSNRANRANRAMTISDSHPPARPSQISPAPSTKETLRLTLATAVANSHGIRVQFFLPWPLPEVYLHFKTVVICTSFC